MVRKYMIERDDERENVEIEVGPRKMPMGFGFMKGSHGPFWECLPPHEPPMVWPGRHRGPRGKGMRGPYGGLRFGPRYGPGPMVSQVEKDGVLKVFFMLPGMKKESIDVRTNPEVIVVSAERKDELVEDIGEAKINLSVNLASTVIPEKAKAKYEDGVLIVEVPIREEETKKQVPVE